MARRMLGANAPAHAPRGRPIAPKRNTGGLAAYASRRLAAPGTHTSAGAAMPGAPGIRRAFGHSRAGYARFLPARVQRRPQRSIIAAA